MVRKSVHKVQVWKNANELPVLYTCHVTTADRDARLAAMTAGRHAARHCHGMLVMAPEITAFPPTG